jgi:RNA polymerase sigma factor (sigma-70 family)
MVENVGSAMITSGMSLEDAQRRIEAFRTRFKEPHFYFAQHAAFALALTPDLLYRLWANFQRDIYNERLKIPWLAVSDLLLSPLCEEVDVGYELYEMDITVRAQLLNSLQVHSRFGKKRIHDLADFLQDYAYQQFKSADPTILEVARGQIWTVLAYIRTDETADELKKAFAALQKNDEIEKIRIITLMETFGQLAEPFAALKGFVPALVYMQERLNASVADVSEIVEKQQEIEDASDYVSKMQDHITKPEMSSFGRFSVDEAFIYIYDRHIEDLRHYLRNLGVLEPLNDIIHEAYLRLYSRMKMIREPTEVEKVETMVAYLYTIARNIVYDNHRRNKRISHINGEVNDTLLQSIPDKALLPEEVYEEKELIEALKKAIEKLPEKIAEAVRGLIEGKNI